MKKQYTKPTMSVVELQHKCQILAGSLKSLNNNADLDLIGNDAGYIDGGGYIR